MTDPQPIDTGTTQKKHDEGQDHITRADDGTGYDMEDAEKNAAGEMRQLPDLQRRLKSRHLAMIAIGKLDQTPT